MRDLQQLPQLADSLSYLYVEHCVIEKHQQAIKLVDQEGVTMVPVAALNVLLLGPGTSITHAAIKVLAESGCSLVWVGEDGTRCYAQGGGETRKGYRLLHQARLASDPTLRLAVCRRMYQMRFQQVLDPSLTLEQLRGMEGARVRSTYNSLSVRYHVPWNGRLYDRAHWDKNDPINTAICAANALLNGLCHAAIVAGGYSPGLGFIHNGLQLSFVYDIADLYKVEITLPIAFQVVAESMQGIEARVRKACRTAFKEHKLLQRILPDIEYILDIPTEISRAGKGADEDPGRPEPLWDIENLLGTPDLERAAELSKGLPPESATLPAPLNSPVVERTLELTQKVGLEQRRQRAIEGLANGWKVYPIDEHTWHVHTQTDKPPYTIQKQNGNWICDCPDFQRSGLGMCKHTFAVKLSLQTAIEDTELV